MTAARRIRPAPALIALSLCAAFEDDTDDPAWKKVHDAGNKAWARLNEHEARLAARETGR